MRKEYLILHNWVKTFCIKNDKAITVYKKIIVVSYLKPYNGFWFGLVGFMAYQPL